MSSLARFSSLSLALVTLAACGAPPAPAAPENAPATARSSAPNAPVAAPAPDAAAGRDPAVMALANAVLTTCKVDEEGGEDAECAAVKAWDENEEAFADGKADATLFSMLGDPQARVRNLAERKGGISSAFWSDKAHATALAEMAKANKDEKLASTLGNLITDVDWQAIGLGDTLKDLVAHTPTDARRAIGIHILERSVNPATVAAATMLADDADRHVADPAVEELWRGDGEAPVCDLLAKLMTGGDYRQSTALMSASRVKKCSGMADRVVAELGKRASDPGKVDRENNRAYDYVRATRHLCLHQDGEAVKKQGLALLKRFMAPAIADAHSRARAMDFYVECGAKDAAVVVGAFTNDKAIGSDAKEILAKMKAEAGKKKKK